MKNIFNLLDEVHFMDNNKARVGLIYSIIGVGLLNNKLLFNHNFHDNKLFFKSITYGIMVKIKSGANVLVNTSNSDFDLTNQDLVVGDETTLIMQENLYKTRKELIDSL